MADLILKKRNGTETTRIVVGEGIPRISYLSLEGFDWLLNAFSTRVGGVSTRQYESMNLSFTQGDDDAKVRENFRLFASSMGIRPEQMVYSHQTHTTNVCEVNESHMGMGICKERSFSDIDGIMTDVPGVCLVTSYADCVPLYFVDPVHNAIALSHSGWRGTIGNICQNTVDEMHRRYGTVPADLVACIGPSICADCYEVSADVADVFKEAYDENDRVVLPALSGEEGKYQLDLTAANVVNMKKAGILPEHISLPDLCTCCNKEGLHSHRGSHGKRGGLCAFLMIR
ncbi:MAG: peptidoglycan editing factor PgeF [Lachnospiraceae bacterium]|nr:peptidoglycan editing factor PgeF [Lachnospiraceae bacterium]